MPGSEKIRTTTPLPLSVNLAETCEVTSQETVLDSDFPDADINMWDEGERVYYAIGTQTVRDGRFLLGQSAISYDLAHWELQPQPILEQLPDWCGDAIFYAGHTVRHPSGYFFHYYSTSVKQGNGEDWKGISVARSVSPNYGFVDESVSPLVCGPGNSCIDPFVFDGMLYFGSAGYPIRRVPLTENGLTILDPSRIKVMLESVPGERYKKKPEATLVYEHNGSIFMLNTGDACFDNGEGSDYFRGDIEKYGGYGTTVSRYSPELDRFIGRSGKESSRNLVLEGNYRYKNPGSVCRVLDRETGIHWLFASAIDRNNQYFGDVPGYPELKSFNRRVLIRTPLFYDEDGWPYVNGGRFEPV